MSRLLAGCSGPWYVVFRASWTRGAVSTIQPLLVQLLHVGTGLREPHGDVSVDTLHLLQQGLVCAPTLSLGLTSVVKASPGTGKDLHKVEWELALLNYLFMKKFLDIKFYIQGYIHIKILSTAKLPSTRKDFALTRILICPHSEVFF